MNSTYNPNLTKKEQQIYDLICVQGVGLNKKSELKNYLKMSSSTIDTHIEHIYQKKFVHSRAELVWQHYQEN